MRSACSSCVPRAAVGARGSDARLASGAAAAGEIVSAMVRPRSSAGRETRLQTVAPRYAQARRIADAATRAVRRYVTSCTDLRPPLLVRRGRFEVEAAQAGHHGRDEGYDAQRHERPGHDAG